MQQLLVLMEANPDIAWGFFKSIKEALGRFWRNAEAELNFMGPPTKCIAEWKKVWADQKKYVRQKAAQNIKDKKCTGGGPSREQKFSPTEEAIYNLIGMKSSVEGVSVKTFGLSPSNAKEVELPLLTDLVSVDYVVSDLSEGVQDVEILPTHSTTAATTRPKTLNYEKVDMPKELDKNPHDALQAELEVQRQLLDTIKLVVANQKEQEQSTRKIYRSLDKINEQNQKHFKEMESIKREELQEIRRHNTFMEKLRVREVEYNLDKKNRLQLQI